VLLVQSRVGDIVSGWLLIGQPIKVSPEWIEQSIVAEPDPRQWVCIGARHDRQDYYGHRPLSDVLRDVNVNIMLVLFPLTVIPMGPIPGDRHILRAGKDYRVWSSRLPEGYLMLDTVRIDFP
jgi:hypothetical protein